VDATLIYILLDEKKNNRITLKGDMFKYLIKVRRHNLDDEIAVRFKDSMEILYRYKIDLIENRVLELSLLKEEKEEIKATQNLHIAWCVIDVKSIEKVLPSLSEIGVNKISFISCDRSQNVKLDFKRFDRLLEASMQQCGRSTYIEFDTYKDIESFIKKYPDTKVFDFCENSLKDGNGFQRVLIGCEGGFSQKEREFLVSQEVFRLNTPMVLRSESAVMAVASKILL